MGRRRRAVMVAVAFGLLCLAACGSSSDDQPPASALRDRAITVASFNFPESEMLAHVYGKALEAGGYPVRFALDLGPRELVDPALARGLVEFVPEYVGTALQFLSLGDAPSSSDPEANYQALVRSARRRSVVALSPSPAQDANAVVVTSTTASRYGLNDISDLRSVAPRLSFGGPPECPTRPLCLRGLRSIYGIRFKSFLPLDSGGPLTRQALLAGQVDVALLFSTDPSIGGGKVVSLTDDRRLQPAENIVPMVHREVVERWGPKVVERVDEVSRRLTTEALRALNAEVAGGRRGSAEVAARWLSREGLA